MNAKLLSDKITNNIKPVIKGKDDIIKKLVISIFSYGHVLLEDVPGTGKTTLTKALAKSINGNFSRIQFTPDLLPSDVTGINFYNRKDDTFLFRKGPVFTNILLADEINRATPKTQSSLLECMEERQTTVDGKTYNMAEPFLVIATQNPIETQGTYPLPEAQLDRFLMKLTLGYPQADDEKDILLTRESSDPLSSICPVADSEDIIAAHNEIMKVTVSEAVAQYIIAIASATRNHSGIRLGASPRSSIALMHAAQAVAAIDGRDYVLPDDVKFIAADVLAHRIIPKGINILKESSPARDIIAEILNSVMIPD